MQTISLKQPFFIGIAGSGMSALAQYLAQKGLCVKGSDRSLSTFEKTPNARVFNNLGIKVYPQTGEGLSPDCSVVVRSTAIEDQHPELQKARANNTPIISRSDLLARLALEKKSIAVGGTSGKSSVCAMLFEILNAHGLNPSLLNGANLNRLSAEGLPGNSYYGEGDYLVFEADESDGSIVKYQPFASLLLNIQKDHQEISQLIPLFQSFLNNTHKHVVINGEDPEISKLKIPETLNLAQYKLSDVYAGSKRLPVEEICILGWGSKFKIGSIPFELQVPGEFNLQNALAAISTALCLGVPLEICSKALSQYTGIERRLYKVGQAKNIWVLDDFAHNPAKVEACLKAVVQLKNSSPDFKRIVALFHPHGFAPMKLMGGELCEVFTRVLDPGDLVWFPEIYYAGGTAQKDISSRDLIATINKTLNIGSFFEEKQEILKKAPQLCRPGDIIISMGARDPYLGQFAKDLLAAFV